MLRLAFAVCAIATIFMQSPHRVPVDLQGSLAAANRQATERLAETLAASDVAPVLAGAMLRRTIGGASDPNPVPGEPKR